MASNLITKDLLDKIDRRIEILGESERKKCLDLTLTRLRELGISQSTSLDDDNRERLDEVIDNYNAALEVGKQIYHGNWDNLFVALQEVAAVVEPSQRKLGTSYAPFRNTITSIPGMQYVPPADEFRIRNELERVRDFSLRHHLHPLEETAFLYFHVARIQPFDSGNKRTASVIMNAEHEAHGYPYIAVGPTDQPRFARRFERAIEGYRQDMSSGANNIGYHNIGPEQHQFFEAWGRRMLDTIKAVETNVELIPRYRVTMKTRKPGLEFAVKKTVQSRIGFNGGLCEALLRRSEHALYVSADINAEQLHDIVGTVKGVRYSIERIN